MRLTYSWIILTSFLGFGFLPEKIPDYSDTYNHENILLVERQECGCPCANALILKGKVQLSDSLQKKFPQLVMNKTEVSLTDFSPFSNVTEDYNFVFDNKFKVTGQVIGIDSILCDPTNCEVVPKFKVTAWTLTSYYPRFWGFNSVIMVTYILTGVIGLPMLTILTMMNWVQRRNKRTKG